MSGQSTSKSSTKKHEKSKNPCLQQLPPSIVKLSERIGLRKVPDDYIKQFLKNILPPSSSDSIDNFKRYLFGHEKFKKKKNENKTKKKKTLNAKEHRKLAVFKLDPNTTKFETFLPINKLWQNYMTNLLQLKNPAPDDLSIVYQKLVKADYHGCMLVVVSSKCPSYVGARGLVIQETKYTFKLINEEHKIRTILKRGSVFCFELNENIFKIYGDNFCYAPHERVRIKYKMKTIADHYENFG